MKAHRNEILKKKKESHEAHLAMLTDMTFEEIKAVRKRYEREYAALERSIKDEQIKQLAKMRNAMLKRQIEKDRFKKTKDQAEKAEESRKKIKRMKTGMAKAFRGMIAKKMGVKKTDLLANADDILRAKLKAWQREVQDHRTDQGGESADIWNVEAEREIKMEAAR